MKKITEKELNEILRKHQMWLNKEEGGQLADLREVDLSGRDLEGANLQGANLEWANLDYSCLPLWCGSLSAHFDDRQLIQIAYHLVKAGLQSKNASNETKKELAKLIDFANKFHRVKECGKIEWEGTK